MRTTTKVQRTIDALTERGMPYDHAYLIAYTLDAHDLSASWETYDETSALIVETDEGGAVILLPERGFHEWYAWYATDSADPSLLVGGSMVEETYDHGPDVVVVLSNAIDGREDVANQY